MTHTDDNSNFLKYQDLTKYCIGHGVPFSFSLSTKDGTSFSFSSPGLPKLSLHSFPPPTRQTSWRNTEINRKWEHSHPVTFKHKTPSQRRRDQRRWTEFQERKTAPSGTSEPSSNIVEQSPILESSPTLDSEPPIIVDLPLFMESPPPPARANSPPSVDPSPTLEPSPIVDFQPLIERPAVIMELPPIIVESPSEMEVDCPPPVISPLSSPSKPSKFPSKGEIVPDIHDKLLVVINSEQSKEAIASLRRTLKKLNQKSIKLEPIEAFSQIRGTFGYKINVPPTRFKHIIENINKNWIPVDKASIQDFYVDRQGRYFPSSSII